jgi:hypothetical protein
VPAAVAEAFMPETTREKLRAFLNIIGRYMTEYSAKLELEHHESQLRLDVRNLTVVADAPDGPLRSRRALQPHLLDSSNQRD